MFYLQVLHLLYCTYGRRRCYTHFGRYRKYLILINTEMSTPCHQYTKVGRVHILCQKFKYCLTISRNTLIALSLVHHVYSGQSPCLFWRSILVTLGVTATLRDFKYYIGVFASLRALPHLPQYLNI